MKSFIIFVLVLSQIISCSHMQTSQLDEIFQEQEPLEPPSKNQFPIVTQLPGPDFKIDTKSISAIEFDQENRLRLTPGDYVIPVMTYCVLPSGSSPDAHAYTLSELKGKRAEIFREVQSRALTKFPPHDIQILIWSLQSGLKYEELTKESRQIIDEVVPPAITHELRGSLLEEIERKWDKASQFSQGALPSFKQSSSELLDSLGDAGKRVIEIRKFRERLKRAGNNFNELRQMIEVEDRSKRKRRLDLHTSIKTPWSRIHDRAYARFVTEGRFQEIGYIQIRVLPDPQLRRVNSVVQKKEDQITLDVLSWLADPRNPQIQPLSFSMIYGYGGIVVIPALAEAPLAATLLLAAVLAAKVIDWNKFFELKKMIEGSPHPELQKHLKDGISTLHKVHDELEKPAKEAGIISGKTNKTKEGKENNTREYSKSGGDEQLKKDFEKLQGEVSKASDGTTIKTLPNGNKAVYRPTSKSNEIPTLEIQPPSLNLKNPRLRIKIRYPTK